jgi:hypothetical protein
MSRRRRRLLGGGESYDADAQAYFDAVALAGGTLDDTYKTNINDYVVALKAANLWTKFDRLWLFANADSIAALMCLKSLEVATPINAPTFTAGQGYAGNGSTSYLNTGFIPATHGVNYLQDAAAIGLYCRDNPGGIGNWRDMGCDATAGGPSLQLLARFNDNTADGAINNAPGGFVAAAAASSIGLWLLTRTGAGAVRLDKDGASFATGTAASNGRPNNEMLLCAYNASGSAGTPNPGAFTPRQYSLAFIGGAFSGAESAAFDTCVDTLKTAIGF